MNEFEARWRGGFYARQKAAAGPVIIGVVVGSILVTGWYVMFLFGRLTLLVQLPVALVTIVVFEVCARGMNLAFGAPDELELAAVAVARCGACGACMEAQGGATLSSCAHCRSAQLAPATVFRELTATLDSAGAEASAREALQLRAAGAAASRWERPAVVLTIVSVLALFPAVGWLAWSTRDVADASVAWGLTPVVLFGLVCVLRFAAVVRETARRRAQTLERIRALETRGSRRAR